MKSLYRPRAYLPEKALVTAVVVNSLEARAARCTAPVPASSALRKAVPAWTATAPREIAARVSAPVTMPPAAINGISRSDKSLSSTCRGVIPAGPVASNVPLCPPASGPWTQSTSAPAAIASFASAREVTVTVTDTPRSCNVVTTPASGTSKVKDTTAGASSERTSSLLCQSSSSCLGSPSVTCRRDASAARESA